MVGKKEYDIKVESERWEVRIPAGDCKRATNYKIRAVEDEVTVNGKAVPVGSQTHPSMSTCLQCHNDDVAPLDCRLCHVGRPPERRPGK